MVEFETVYRQRQALILEPRGREVFPLCQKRANKNRHFALVHFCPQFSMLCTHHLQLPIAAASYRHIKPRPGPKSPAHVDVGPSA